MEMTRKTSSSLLHGTHAAIDGQGVAADVAGFVGQQPYDGISDLVRDRMGPSPCLTFRAHFCHFALMETHAFGFRLPANAPEGQKRFPISYCPRQLLLVPGLTLALLGLLGYLIALPGARIGGVTFDAHTMLFASLAIIAGYQSAVFAKTFAIAEGLLPADFHLEEFRRVVTLERRLIGGIFVGVPGFLLLSAAVNEWRIHAFGLLDYAQTMRLVVPGVTLSVLGFQTVLGCFFLSLMDLRRC